MIRKAILLHLGLEGDATSHYSDRVRHLYKVILMVRFRSGGCQFGSVGLNGLGSRPAALSFGFSGFGHFTVHKRQKTPISMLDIRIWEPGNFNKFQVYYATLIIRNPKEMQIHIYR